MTTKIKNLQSITLNDKTKEEINKRLNRLEGQIHGLQRMVDGNRYCLDILTQISSVQEALRGLGKRIFREWLETSVDSSLSSKERGQIDRTYNEIIELLYKYAK